MIRPPIIVEPPEQFRSHYKELKSYVEEQVVGYICVECGRLNTAPHRDDCSLGVQESEILDNKSSRELGGGK